MDNLFGLGRSSRKIRDTRDVIRGSLRRDPTLAPILRVLAAITFHRVVFDDTYVEVALQPSTHLTNRFGHNRFS